MKNRMSKLNFKFAPPNHPYGLSLFFDTLAAFVLVLVLSQVAHAKVTSVIAKQPRTYQGFATINKDTKQIKFETPEATLYFQLPPVAIRNQFEFKSYKPNREIQLKVHDSEIIRIEPRQPQQTRTPANKNK